MNNNIFNYSCLTNDMTFVKHVCQTLFVQNISKGYYNLYKLFYNNCNREKTVDIINFVHNTFLNEKHYSRKDIVNTLLKCIELLFTTEIELHMSIHFLECVANNMNATHDERLFLIGVCFLF